jgi:hypothetical protein
MLEMLSLIHHHHHLQGLGLLAYSDLPVRRIDPSISSVVDLYLFFQLMQEVLKHSFTSDAFLAPP